MNAQEWQTCDEPLKMFASLHGRLTARKLALFGCASARWAWESLEDPLGCDALRVAERLADLRDPHKNFVELLVEKTLQGLRLDESQTAWHIFWSSGTATLRRIFEAAGTTKDDPLTPADRADIFRELFAPPDFARPDALPRWLAWNDGCVRKLAYDIYEERRFADLPILADALLDAGCDCEALLNHLRRPQRHALGCWVLDSLLRLE